jgi:succinoglycan biosynthesis transport protein ExoP
VAAEASHYDASSLSTYLRVLRRRKWIVVVSVLVVTALALGFSLRQPAQYAASADVLLSRQNLGNALTGTSDFTLIDGDRLTVTQADLAHTPDVARATLTIAKTKDLTADELLARSTVGAKGTSDILEFRVTDRDARRAELLATSFAQAYVAYRGRLDTKSLAKARREVASTLAQLRSQGRDKSALYTSLEEKNQQLQTLLTLQTSQASVSRRAEYSTKIAPTPMRDALLGLALGLVLGVGLAFGIDALDTRVRSATEIGERLDLPLLARVPPPPKGFAKERRLVMMSQPTGASAEAYRMLRTNLDFVRLEGEDVRLILVTSAVEEEGKSTTAANLAVAEARAGRRVALVDLDLRRPFIDRFFGLTHVAGITDVALGTVPLEKALLRVDLAVGVTAAHGQARAETNGNADRGLLDVLVSGPLPPDPGEFVGTKKLAEILARLRAAYDLVIVDTPPALRVGDALVLSAQADGVLAVTRLKVVRRPLLRELRRALDATPVRKLGFVMTGADSGSAVGYGPGFPYGGYGYGDRDAGGRGKADKARGKERDVAVAKPQDAAKAATRV